MLLDDYILAIAAAVTVAAAVILGSFLVRVRGLIQEADKSTRLAKDVWESMNSRFAVVDARLVDLMAKTEVLTTRATKPSPQAPTAPPIRAEAPTVARVQAPRVAVKETSVPESSEIDARILGFLANGARSSAQIKEEIGRSREHTARLMKALYERGFVVRNDRHKPYVYEITDAGRAYVAS